MGEIEFQLNFFRFMRPLLGTRYRTVVGVFNNSNCDFSLLFFSFPSLSMLGHTTPMPHYSQARIRISGGGLLFVLYRLLQPAATDI